MQLDGKPGTNNEKYIFVDRCAAHLNKDTSWNTTQWSCSSQLPVPVPTSLWIWWSPIHSSAITKRNSSNRLSPWQLAKCSKMLHKWSWINCLQWTSDQNCW